MFVRRAGRIDVCTETHAITRVLDEYTKRKSPNIPRAPPVPSQGGSQREEPRQKLLEHGARSLRGSRGGRSGSDSEGVCWPMGSLSKKSPRQWSFEGLIPVCLSVARRAYASEPRNARKVQVDGRSWCLCWQLAEMCCAICWQSAEKPSLMGGA